MMELEQRFPWPVPDPRMRITVGGVNDDGSVRMIEYSDMHRVVEGMEVPPGAPEAAASVLTTARELMRMSFYRWEFMVVSVCWSLFAVETALRERLSAPRKTFDQLIKLAVEEGVLSGDMGDRLHAGRTIRNQVAHGKSTHSAYTIGLAVPMLQASFDVIGLLYPPESDNSAGQEPFADIHR
ncbi:DUF4145 domain-containing protein [Streptomyces laurentii]|uniref:DUF4145 domain-containing protein n=1 Tax=Streptomyces laurentii TaxID=39478 RepID=UPI003689D09C